MTDLTDSGVVSIVQPPAEAYTRRTVTVDDRIVEYLSCDDGVDSPLETTLQAYGGEEAFRLRNAETSLDDLTIDAALHDRLTSLAADTSQSRRCYWHGPDGTEKQRAVAAVCKGGSYLQVDLLAVLKAGALDRLHREITLLDRPLLLTGATKALDADPRDRTLETVFGLFEDLDTDVFITGTEAWTPTETMATDIDAIIEFPYPSIALRQQFWERHADALPAVEPV